MRFVVGVNDKGIFQPKWFFDSVAFNLDQKAFRKTFSVLCGCSASLN